MRPRTRVAGSLLTLAVAMVALLAFTATTAGAAVSVTVSPNTGLLDGQVVHVEATGSTGSVALAECTAAAVAAHDLSGCVASTIIFVSSGDMALQQVILTPAGLVDCGISAGTCVVAAVDTQTFAFLATAPLSFAAPAPPTFRVVRTTNLLDGDTLDVAASGFAANQIALVQECGPDTSSVHCDLADALPTQTSSTGAFFVHFTARRVLTTATGPIDCAFVSCVITAPPAVTATVPLTFVSASASVTPTTGLHDGQAVTVTAAPGPGHSFVPFSLIPGNTGVAIAECTVAARNIHHPDSSLFGICGNVVNPVVSSPTEPVTTSYLVHESIVSVQGGNQIRCGASPGDCVVGVLESLGDIFTDPVFTFPISFGPPNQPPVCTTAFAAPAVLWPPDHTLRSVTVRGVSDPDRDAVTVTITTVTQDEPVLGNGSGNTAPDAVLGPTSDSVELRAERSGAGNGRVYAISFQASDGKGGTCGGTVHVGVPHDSSGQQAIDSGQRYDSLVPR